MKNYAKYEKTIIKNKTIIINIFKKIIFNFEINNLININIKNFE